MNFTAVRGFNAYAQFSAKIREAVKSRAETSQEAEKLQDSSRSLYVEPVDTVTISEPARNASNALMVIRENSPHLEFREWAKSVNKAGVFSGEFSQKVPGSVMNEALAGSGIAVGDNEEYALKVDVKAAVSVSSKNAEKAKAIQDLLNSTPSGINWGMLLAKLPPM